MSDGGGPRILILTVPHGASHRRLAAALRKAFLEIRPGLTVEIADALEHCARWFRLYYDSYTLPLRYWPALWAWIENLQHTRPSTGPNWLYRRGAKPLFRFIAAFAPDIVIATEVGTCEMVAMYKRETAARFLLIGAITGIDVDRAWAQREVDLYPVGPGDMAAQLELAGVAPSRILPCGVPVDPEFSHLPDRLTTRTRLQVARDVPVVLALFGGAGFGNPRRILAALEEIKLPFQATFIAGKNRRLQQKLERVSAGHASWRVLGWVQNMHEWMAAADLLVSKPGASTLVEAITCGLPLLAFDPLPGNERRACDWIEKRQIGHWARNTKDLAATIERWLANPQELCRLRESALALARPNAARDAALAILKLWESRN